MSRYWAEIDSNNEVLRVANDDAQEWLQENLGGTFDRWWTPIKPA